MESKDLIGKEVKILAIGNSAIIVEDEENKKQYVIYAYCACNSGYWYLSHSGIDDNNFDKFSDEIEELYLSLKQKSLIK